ncbi:MAG: hypothetical protein ICV62_11440 [Cyanobacteria bacterium Co-bin13]|nr:hypothetical protein [Cyanobacteria bacterium Co-bin13]
MRSPWISWILLTLVYLTFGRFLQSAQMLHAVYPWFMSAGFAIAQAAVLTLLWQPAQKILLLGFQSDSGHVIMVLLLASLAVAAVVQFQVFSYLAVLVAAALLARVETLLTGVGNTVAFLILAFFPLLGLGLSWMLVYLFDGVAPAAVGP